MLSGLTFLAGSMLAYAASLHFDVGWLVPVAAGNFPFLAGGSLAVPRGDIV